VSVELEVLADPAPACAALLLGAAIGGGHLVITGGTTAGAAYVEFAAAVRTVGLDLSRTTFWFSDERCVPPDDRLSNYGVLKRTLLDPVSDLARPVVRRMQGELGPFDAADAYERELSEHGPGGFELVLLGMGSDAHIASLFPDQHTLSERSRQVVGVRDAGLEPFVPRVSLTLPALVRGERIVVLVTGEAKAQAVAAAFGPEARPDPSVPASLLAAQANEVIVLLDRAAAGRL
jgi:6-phosphogluconolactonase